MPLFKTNSSHLTICFESSPDVLEIIELLKSKPPKNILGLKDLGHTGYRGSDEAFPEHLVSLDEVICFTEITTEKILPMKLIRALVDEVRIRDFSHLTAREFKNDGSHEEVQDAIMEEISPKCSTREIKTEILIDTKAKRIYIELKSIGRNYVSINRLERNLELVGPYIRARFSNNAKKDASEEFLNELFIFWLYQKTMNVEFKDHLVMTSKLKVKDRNTTISVSGEIDHFIDIYKKLKPGRRIDSISLSLPLDIKDELEGNKFEFTLTNKTQGVKNYKSHVFGTRGAISVSGMTERLHSLKEINLYIDKLVHQFEKEIEGKMLGDLFKELRGMDED